MKKNPLSVKYQGHNKFFLLHTVISLATCLKSATKRRSTSSCCDPYKASTVCMSVRLLPRLVVESFRRFQIPFFPIKRWLMSKEWARANHTQSPLHLPKCPWKKSLSKGDEKELLAPSSTIIIAAFLFVMLLLWCRWSERHGGEILSI